MLQILKPAEQLEQAIRAWPSIEGIIAAKSQEVYTAIEIDLSRTAGRCSNFNPTHTAFPNTPPSRRAASHPTGPVL
jgi:hypothetical protein